jgi:hypothetical protein
MADVYVDAELNQFRSQRLKGVACGRKRLTKQGARRKIKHGIQIVGLRKTFGLCCGYVVRLPVWVTLRIWILLLQDGLLTRASFGRRFPNLSRLRTRRALAFSDSFSLLGGDNQCKLRVSRLSGLAPTQQWTITCTDFDWCLSLFEVRRSTRKQEMINLVVVLG